MQTNTLKVLLIEDNPGDARLIAELVRGTVPRRIELEHVENLETGVQRLVDDHIEVVLLDLYLPGSEGVETYNAIRKAAPHMPIVVLTGKDDEGELASELLKAGAQDYLVKGQVDSRMLWRSLRYAVERGRIERQLRERADELAAETRRKDEFLAVLAHELRNPLAPIAMAVGLLRSNKIEPEQREWSYEMIGRQTRHMSRLIDDLLDVSRISRGKIVLQKELIDLATVVQRAADSAMPDINKNRHQFSTTLPQQTVWLEADPVRLEQVIVNLLTNAAKFTEPGGRVDLIVELCDGHAIIRVRDTGIGIPTDMLDRIFELFSQVDRSTSRQTQWGLGIGLSLVKGLVELHGGSVRAVSEGPGRGSEIIVTLPLHVASDLRQIDDAAPLSPASASCQPCRVLIVDDQPEFTESAASLLRSWGHQVEVANNGGQALAAAQLLHPDVVLLDISMPCMDGFDVVRALRQLPASRHAMIIAVTGYGRGEDRLRTQQAGFNSHLVKPVAPETLRSLLAELQCEPKLELGLGKACPGASR